MILKKSSSWGKQSEEASLVILQKVYMCIANKNILIKQIRNHDYILHFCSSNQRYSSKIMIQAQ